MKPISLRTYGLLILFCVLTSCGAMPTSESISSFGSIEYSTQELVLKRFTGTHNFRRMSTEEIAELFDMCLAWPKDEEVIRQVKRVRPDFTALYYRNIRAMYDGRQDEWQLALKNNWLLKDENGKYVHVLTWPRNYLVDIGNPEYQVWVVNSIKEGVNQFGYDGVWADCSLSARASEHFFDVSGKPINPRTGVYWTDSEVRQALIKLHTRLRQAIGSKPIICNGIFEGRRFERYINQYRSVLSDCPIDGLMSEGLWYQYNGVWMSEEQWLQCLNMLVRLQDMYLKERTDRIFVPTCKLESFGGRPYPIPSDCSAEQMATYAFASTLLGIKVNQNYLCLLADVEFTARVVQPLHDIIIGSPTSDYYMLAGSRVYARDFTRAKVLVNPTSSSYTVDLKDLFTTLGGEIVTEIVMEAHSGEILTKSSSS